jgi:hypothetical protein
MEVYKERDEELRRGQVVLNIMWNVCVQFSAVFFFFFSDDDFYQ